VLSPVFFFEKNQLKKIKNQFVFFNTKKKHDDNTTTTTTLQKKSRERA